jgi:hypothetical protein
MHFIIHQTKKYSAHQLFPSKLFILVLSLLLLYSVAVIAQDTSKSEIVLRSVADAVLKNAAFQFIDQKSGDRFSTPEDAPLNAQLKPVSPYNDWR